MDAATQKNLPVRLFVAAVVTMMAAAVLWAFSEEAHGSDPVVTSDIVLLGPDALAPPDLGEFSIRNDGDVAYRYQRHQPQCGLDYEDGSGREFRIPSAVHCDLPEETDILPGQTVTVIAFWALDECTELGFFCEATRPLPTGDYTISGSLLSADGTMRAEFSKAVAITGPTFTNDITATFSTEVSAVGVPSVDLTLSNGGNVGYLVGPDDCSLRLKKPDGTPFFIPRSIDCEGAPVVLAAGGQLNVINDWHLDECIAFNFEGGCANSQALPEGVYTAEASGISEDRGHYAEFSAAYTIVTTTTTPSPTPVPPADFPRTGGSPEVGDVRGTMVALAALLVLAGAVTTLAWSGAGRRNEP